MASSLLDLCDSIFCDEARLGWGDRMSTLAFDTFLGGVYARGFFLGVDGLIAAGGSPSPFLVDLGAGGVGGRFLELSASPAMPSSLSGRSLRCFFTEIVGDAGNSCARARAPVNSSGEASDLASETASEMGASGGVSGRAWGVDFGLGFGFGFGFDVDTDGLLSSVVTTLFLTGSVLSSFFSNMEMRVFVDERDLVSVARSVLSVEFSVSCGMAWLPCCLFAAG